MSQIGQRERKTQDRIVNLFKQQLCYHYLGNWQDRPDNSHIEVPILRQFLREKQGYSDTLINKALYELEKVAGDQTKSLHDLNKAVYSLLRYGVKVKEDVGENTQTVWLINWNQPLDNDFAFAEEVTIKGQHNKRPDIVLYVNGIALAVLELKRSTISVAEGIRQNLDNQKSIFIKHFFSTMQLIMAGNDTEGLRYGTVETAAKYYMTWKEDETWGNPSGVEEPLDKHLLELCRPARLLEIIHDFTVFDRGSKKICRHNQYFGVKAAQAYLRRREGGIIWHTQGSGKSLTMVWLTKWIRENITDARVLIVTDRDELDKQIEKVFLGVQETIHRTTSGADLLAKLNDTFPWLLCSLIHKFGRSEEADYDHYIAELQSSLPQDFKAKGDIYVFVDECHRTQSGKLHDAMNAILSNPLLIGFTGTPLLKQDKKKSIEVFGPYIHTYKYNQAVADKVVLDLRYEARNIEQTVRSPERIDRWFEAKTKELTDHAKTELKARWGTLQKVLSSRERLDRIVEDIIFDMETKDRLQNGRGNALLVSGSIYQACKYYELFQNAGFTKCAIVTSYRPTISDVKGESTGEENPTEKLKQYEIYQKMLNGQEVEAFEEAVKKRFIEEPAQMKLLIVVDKLLTGFDAPSATYLYIDKTMRDHGLFQAICRVNRLDGEDKEYGYIVDYKDLFKSLEKSIHDYTSEAFDQFDREDVAGLLTNRLTKARERLDEAREQIKALCEPVPPPRDSNAHRRYFCGRTDDPDGLQATEQKRHALYQLTASLVRAYANLANEMEEAGYSSAESTQIKYEVKYYEQLRSEIKLASGDYIDLKTYEPAMRHLIDTYIGAEDSREISAFDDLTLIQLVVERGPAAFDQLPPGIAHKPEAVAETIENNLRKVITDERPTNPKYFERMSILLEELIEQRNAAALEYEQYLRKVVELTRQVANPNRLSYPTSLNTPAQRALYDNLNRDEKLALVLDRDIQNTKKDDWRGNTIKTREVEYIIRKHVPEEDVSRIMELVNNQSEY